MPNEAKKNFDSLCRVKYGVCDRFPRDQVHFSPSPHQLDPRCHASYISHQQQQSCSSGVQTCAGGARKQHAQAATYIQANQGSAACRTMQGHCHCTDVHSGTGSPTSSTYPHLPTNPTNPSQPPAHPPATSSSSLNTASAYAHLPTYQPYHTNQIQPAAGSHAPRLVQLLEHGERHHVVRAAHKVMRAQVAQDALDGV